MAAACSSLSTSKIPLSTPKFSLKPHQNSSLQPTTALSRREFLNGSSVALLPLLISPLRLHWPRKLRWDHTSRPRPPTPLSFSSPPLVKTPLLFGQIKRSFNMGAEQCRRRGHAPFVKERECTALQVHPATDMEQMRVANILSGNYCQPKCAEPWVEVKFEDEKQGKIQVVASPLIRLTNKPNAKIEDIGSPEKLIASLGPFVTGNTYDPDELVETSVEKRGDQTYYKYVLETPFALTGSHNLAKATAKGSTVVLFVASANDKQWQSSEKVLQAILESFEV
ncbi:UNVERIFIED_CONTAM: PsbP domain-containing protein 6, chloroplastic [Sesamum latifolium]|uniref:PsbP domain-containing protein 6, chloroplastic n=1 Tax=Sesamum latifolium TaxID=2727402 RepID=A0AAW2VHN7_9LAMI